MGGRPPRRGGGDGEPVLWLIGGEEDDVEAFLDAIDDDEIDGEPRTTPKAEAEAEHGRRPMPDGPG